MKHHRPLAAAAALILCLCGCHVLEPQPDPTRFYVLTSMSGAPQSMVVSAKSSTTIGLGPITLPDYLDQPWMVTRGEGSQLYVSAQDQWGEPLRNSFKDVLKQDLALELGEDQIIDYPWYRTTAVECQVIVEVIAFEFNTAVNSAQIRANWSIVNARTGAIQSRGQFVAAQNAAPSTGLERAAALSRLVQQLAQTLAQQVRRTPSLAQDKDPTRPRQTAAGG